MICEDFVYRDYRVIYHNDNNWCEIRQGDGSWVDTLILTDYVSCSEKRSVIIAVIDGYFPLD